MNKPLAGCRVIDFGNFITGPFAAMLLADMGAEVIKVERPKTGDPFRSFEQGLYGPQYKAFNRNKKSLVIDLNGDADRALFIALIGESDIFIENSRPGVAESFGADFNTLRTVNPRLIYCSITGFGPDGPEAARPAYDTVAQAASGYLSLFVSPGDTTIKGPATADVVTGLYAANGVLAALVERQRTGVGKLVEVAMMGAMAHFASEPYQHYFTRGKVPAPAHRSHISQSFAFECACGRLISVHLSSPEKFWDGLVAATASPVLSSDPRFAHRMERIRNYDALENALADIFLTRDLDSWMESLAMHDVPHAAVHSLEEVVTTPQAIHLGIEQRAMHPTEGAVRAIASPIVFDRQPASGFSAPPVLDENGADLRNWLKARTAD